MDNVENNSDILRQDPTLAEIVRRLVEAYQPLRIYIFGSKARGNDGVDSDYDLLVLVKDDASQEKARSRLGYSALRGTGAAADVVVWRKTPFDARLHLRAAFPTTVVQEGQLFYAS